MKTCGNIRLLLTDTSVKSSGEMRMSANWTISTKGVTACFRRTAPWSRRSWNMVDREKTREREREGFTWRESKKVIDGCVR
ncbi:hypothetical protein PRUPE_2G162900 [Prunus persica]|uniref:Uncharacterized protein n=1 Tax=Prunus persica TaxID=3760 RepID=A0A251QGM4_PRUPE|nr:hypothetical protein PRUPE_2G162900 [Prunus persica]